MWCIAAIFFVYVAVSFALPDCYEPYHSLDDACPVIRRIPFNEMNLNGGILPNETFLDNHCSVLLEAANCAKPYVHCSFELPDAYDLERAAQQLIDNLVELCDKNSSLREAFSKHSACINDVWKDNTCSYRRGYYIEFMDYLKKIGEYHSDRINADECIPLMTSSICLGQAIDAKCVAASVDLYRGLLNGMDKTLNQLCPPEVMGPGIFHYMEYMFKKTRQ